MACKLYLNKAVKLKKAKGAVEQESKFETLAYTQCLKPPAWKTSPRL